MRGRRVWLNESSTQEWISVSAEMTRQEAGGGWTDLCCSQSLPSGAMGSSWGRKSGRS